MNFYVQEVSELTEEIENNIIAAFYPNGKQPQSSVSSINGFVLLLMTRGYF